MVASIKEDPGLWNTSSNMGSGIPVARAIVDPIGFGIHSIFPFGSEDQPQEFIPRTQDPNRIQSAINLARALGIDASRLRQLYRSVGGHPGDQYQGIDFSQSFNMPQAEHLRGLMSYNAGRTTDQGLIRPGVFGKQLEQVQNQANLNQSQAEWQRYGEPAFNDVQGQLEKMIGQPVFSASYVADARSRIAEIVKGSEESRLKQLFAGLGLSGQDPSSPGMAALAHNAALQSDAELSSQLRDFGMSTEQIERTSLERELGLKTQTALQRLTAHQSFLAGDKDRMFQLSNELGGILEAVRSQRELDQLQAQMMREQQDAQRRAQYIQMGLAAAGVVAAPFTGGASLALTAGAAGMNRGGH